MIQTQKVTLQPRKMLNNTFREVQSRQVQKVTDSYNPDFETLIKFARQNPQENDFTDFKKSLKRSQRIENQNKVINAQESIETKIKALALLGCTPRLIVNELNKKQLLTDSNIIIKGFTRAYIDHVEASRVLKNYFPKENIIKALKNQGYGLAARVEALKEMKMSITDAYKILEKEPTRLSNILGVLKDFYPIQSFKQLPINKNDENVKKTILIFTKGLVYHQKLEMMKSFNLKKEDIEGDRIGFNPDSADYFET
jgi:hypothetical protein